VERKGNRLRHQPRGAWAWCGRVRHPGGRGRWGWPQRATRRRGRRRGCRWRGGFLYPW